jgi:hypothetical protein
MKLKYQKLLLSVVIMTIAILLATTMAHCQTNPPATKPTQTQSQSRQTTVGQLQNNSGATQMNAFAPPQPPPPSAPKMEGPQGGFNEGGSKVRANPFLTTADFAIMEKPTYEGGFKSGLSLGFSKSNLSGTASYGGSALFTTDLSQRAISIYKSFANKWYYSYSFAQIAGNQTSGVSVTRIWNKNNRTFGLQIGASEIKGDSLRIAAPSAVAFVEKRFQLSSRLSMNPNVYTTFSSPYYDKDKKNWENDFTFNAIVGTTFSYRFSRKFVVNLGYRGNINTNPKFGLMNNILIGSNFKF